MNLQTFIQNAICVPFCEHGRDYTGWDCWGLIRCGYKDIFGVELPMFLEKYKNTNDYNSIAKVIESERIIKWEESSRILGSVALIKRRGYLVHIGLVATNYEILHCDKIVGTVLEQDIKMNIDGFWKLV